MVNQTTKDIIIRLKYEERGKKQLERAFKNLDRFQERQNLQQQKMIVTSDKVSSKQQILANKQNFYREQMDSLGVTGGKVDDILSHYGFSIDKNGKLMDKAGRPVNNLNKLMREGKIVTERFNMSLLSTMFFGMALQRAYTSLTRTSMEWMGIQDIMNTTLGIVFLPLAEELLDVLLPLSEWFMDLPEEVHSAIGALTAFVGAIGAGMFVFGTMGLGMQGMGRVFGIDMGKGFINGAKNKLSTMDISKYLKYAGATISFGMALKDTAEGKFTAALGDVLMGVGFIKGGKKGAWAMALGVTLKFLGDEEFQKNIYSMFWKIIDTAFVVGEEIEKALTGRWKDIDFGRLTFFTSASEALINLQNEGKITSDRLNDLATNENIRNWKTDWDNLTEAYNNGTISLIKYYEGLEEIKKKYPKILKETNGLNMVLDEQSDKVNKLNKSWKNLNFAEKVDKLYSVFTPTGLMGIGTRRSARINDAIISPGGNIITTNPKDYLIATKNPKELTANNRQNGNTMNVTINANVSSDYDVGRLADELKRYWTTDFERLSMGRTI